MDDIEVVKTLLRENSIPCELNSGAVYILINVVSPYEPLEEDVVNVRRWIFGSHSECAMCKRPDISDPDFIEKVKEFMRLCSKWNDCHECPNKP